VTKNLGCEAKNQSDGLNGMEIHDNLARVPLFKDRPGLTARNEDSGDNLGSGDQDVRMRLADCGIALFVIGGGERRSRIGAVQMESTKVQRLIPERFQFQRCLFFALLPENGNHLSEDGETRAVAERVFSRIRQEASNGLLEKVAVWPVIHHEGGQCVCGIVHYKAAIPGVAANVDSKLAQFFCQQIAMSSVGDDYHRIAKMQAGGYDPAKALYQRRIVVVDVYGMNSRSGHITIRMPRSGTKILSRQDDRNRKCADSAKTELF
jgi:hypothetical protein